MRQCLVCQKDTLNYKYCSRSCAVTINNSRYPKKPRKLRLCKKCNIEIGLGHRGPKVCESCNPNKIDWSTITLGEIKSKLSTHQYHARIRALARQEISYHSSPKICKVCNYSIFVEVCHIKPIQNFDNLSTISTINDITNLVYLCPNHHYELDNNLIKL